MTTNEAPLSPPVDVPEIQRGNWLRLQDDAPVVGYAVENLWDKSDAPVAWELSRLSNAAYVYRETATGWSVVAKFYEVKAGSAAQDYAVRERDYIRQVLELGLSGGSLRAVRYLGLWRGILFLEYVPGLTLENIIAVRHSQPGALLRALQGAARLLVKLHVEGKRDGEQPDFGSAVRYTYEVVEQLAKHGVLQDQPIVRDGVKRLIDQWADASSGAEYLPSLTHGDATTTNFVFPPDGSVVGVDWERLYPGDPAHDLGRLMAEITHSISQHGGSVAEAESFVQQLVAAYAAHLPGEWDIDHLVRRARFHRASSTLRIARNGWVSRLDRTALVAQAMALLVD